MQRLVLLVLALFARVYTAEQVPCITDAATCEVAESQSIVNNKQYCCKIGFSMQWVRGQTSTQTECVCNRFYHVSECLQGQSACQSATSLSNDGVNVKCCKHGARMSSVTNSIVNGVVQNYCRCLQYSSAVPQAGPYVQQADSMATTMQELQLMGALGLLPEEMQTFVNQMSGGGHNNNANANSGALNQIANTFVEGLVQGLIRAISSGNNSTTPNQSVIRRRNRVNNFNRNRNNYMTGRQPALPYPLPPVPVPNFNYRAPQQVSGPIRNSQQNSVMYSSASSNPRGGPQAMIHNVLAERNNPYSNTRRSNGPPSFSAGR